MRATTLVRPSVRSSIRGSRPAPASCSAAYSAAGRSWQSPPPRLVVSMRMRSQVNSTTSSSACWSAILLLHGGRDDGGDRLEGTDSRVHGLAGVRHLPLPDPVDARHDGRGHREMLGVELDRDREPPCLYWFLTDRQ